jgi:hypothetical protein
LPSRHCLDVLVASPRKDQEKEGRTERAQGETTQTPNDQSTNRPSIDLEKLLEKNMLSFPSYLALSALSAAAVVFYAFATREQCVF